MGTWRAGLLGLSGAEGEVRPAIFALVKTARGGVPWTDPDIAILDAALDRLNVPKDEAESNDLKPSRAALSLIKEFEGCEKLLPGGRLAAYPDPATGGDPWTIGWGSTGPDIRKGTIWTQEQADARFAEHVAEFGENVAKLVAGGAATSQQEFDALVSFAYNLGIGNLKTSTLLALHRAGNKAGAAEQFARWNKAAGKVLPGLTRRRAAEAKLYRGAS